METRPSAFARGVPAEQNNGLYGIEDDLIELPAGSQIIAVVTFVVEEAMEKRNAGEQWPVIKIAHIEPLRDDKSEAAALKLRDAAYKARTGENTLDLGDDE